MRKHSLHRLSVLRLDFGAQNLVPAHDFVDRLLQRRNIQSPLEAQADWNVVRRTVRFQLVQNPESLLRERKRKGLLRDFAVSWELRDVQLQDSVVVRFWHAYFLGQPGDGWM